MTDCWLSPYGVIYECQPYGHDDVAQMILGDEFPIEDYRSWIDRAEELGFRRSYPETLEYRGWVRFSTCFNKWCWREGYQPTRDQLNKMFDLTGFVPED